MSNLSGLIYDQFKTEHTTFQRWLVMTVSLCSFFLLVFLPYVSTVREIGVLKAELSQQAEDIKKVQRSVTVATGGIERATSFMGDASEFQALYQETDNWVQDKDEIEQTYDLQSRHVSTLFNALPFELQEKWNPSFQPDSVISELKNLRPQLMQEYPTKKCLFLIEAEWIQCKVNEKLEKVNSHLFRVLYDRTESFELTRKLKKAISENKLAYSEGFKAAVSRSEYVHWVREYLENERKIIRHWYESMAEERSSLVQKADEQKALMENNERERKKLESYQQEIKELGHPETPFGSLPISFHGVIVLFPLLVLIAGTLLSRSQKRLQTLRKHYKLEAAKELKDKEPLQLIMPLFPDTEGKISLAAVAFIVLCTPGVAGVFGIIQLTSVPELIAYGNRISILGIVPATFTAFIIFSAYATGLFLAWLSLRQK